VKSTPLTAVNVPNVLATVSSLISAMVVNPESG
jgi:hypothetical protein